MSFPRTETQSVFSMVVSLASKVAHHDGRLVDAQSVFVEEEEGVRQGGVQCELLRVKDSLSS